MLIPTLVRTLNTKLSVANKELPIIGSSLFATESLVFKVLLFMLSLAFPRLRLAGSSTLWHISSQSGMAVFDNAMLTDSVHSFPAAKIVSYISAEDVEKGAPNWCQQVNFNQLVKQSVRTVKDFPLQKNQEALLKSNKGYLLKEILGKLGKRAKGDVVMSIKDHALNIAAPASIMPAVEASVKRYLDEFSPEQITLTIPKDAVGKLIGSKGSNKTKLVGELNKMIQDLTGQEDEKIERTNCLRSF